MVFYICSLKEVTTMKIKNILASIALSATLVGGVLAGVLANNKAEPVEAAVSSTVTRVYIEDQVTTTPVLAIESISFADGYDHTAWRDFLTSYLGSRSSYTTTSGSDMPSTKGWSYMSNSEQEKYLLCPTGSKNFTMVFPEWVTALSYKAVGNNWWNWFDVNGSPVGLHSGWGIGKKVNSYIYNDSGWKMNANLDNTSQTNTWGDITITANAIKTGTTTQIATKSITMSKYYKISGQTYDIFGYTFGGWYTTNALTTVHNTLLTANATVYAKETQKQEAYVSGTMNNWDADDPNYLMVPHEDSQYRFVGEFAKDVEFKIVYQGSNWYGWSQVDQTSKVVTNSSIIQGSDPDSTGYRIKVNVAGTYEIYLKTTAGSDKLWIQQDSATEAASYATTFLSTITCTNESTTFDINAWNKVGSATTSMEYKYEQLTSGARNLLAEASPNQGGTAIEQCAARYDRILSKYGYGTATGQYHDFMGRTPAKQSAAIRPIISANSNDGNALLIGIVLSAFAVTAIGGYFFLRHRKEN